MNNNNTQCMLSVGTLLHGTYRIDRYLGSGGFGNTYQATNLAFNERVAIKEFFVKGVCERAGDSRSVSISNSENVDNFGHQINKFKKEAQRLRRINNPHVVKVYDLFEENGTAYYVMDFIDGESLSERLKRTNTPMSENEVMEIVSQVLDGLKAIHDNGILHLDLKPGNIMMGSDGQIRLIDFGASKQQDNEGGATTSTGISYTTGYAPLEQISRDFKNFGPCTDFYALGATMFKLLTLNDPPVVSEIQDDPSQDKHISLPMPNVSDAMRNFVLWMVSPRLARPQSADAVYQYLKNVHLGDTQFQTHSASDDTLYSSGNNAANVAGGYNANSGYNAGAANGGTHSNVIFGKPQQRKSGNRNMLIFVFGLVGFFILITVILVVASSKSFTSTPDDDYAIVDTAYVDSVADDEYVDSVAYDDSGNDYSSNDEGYVDEGSLY